MKAVKAIDILDILRNKELQKATNILLQNNAIILCNKIYKYKGLNILRFMNDFINDKTFDNYKTEEDIGRIFNIRCILSPDFLSALNLEQVAEVNLKSVDNKSNFIDRRHILASVAVIAILCTLAISYKKPSIIKNFCGTIKDFFSDLASILVSR